MRGEKRMRLQWQWNRRSSGEVAEVAELLGVLGLGSVRRGQRVGVE